MLLTGNEAIAYGSLAIGVEYFTGYPGTPCTEIGEILERYHEEKCEWSVNEKVALEVAVGISLGGKRVLVGMKTLGLNVAADCFTQLAGTPINGGIVIVAADDVGRIAADDYQDCRFYSIMSQIPLLEPSDSQEAYDFMDIAFEISERYSTPVIVRMNSIICKSKSLVKNVNFQFRKRDTVKTYRRSLQKTVGNIVRFGFKEYDSQYLNSFWLDFEENWRLLKKISDGININFIEDGDSDIGIITTGMTYNYVKEVNRKAGILKLGLAYPLPENMIRNFAQKYKKLFIVEDGHPVIEKEIKCLGIEIKGEAIFPRFPEMLYFTPEIIEEKIFNVKKRKEKKYVPFRLPENCKGCPHSNVNGVLRNLGAITAGGIGCGALAAFPDQGLIDVVKCMGSSIGIAHGYNKCSHEQMIAVMGDGEFWHTGINCIINAYYNGGNALVIIEDNSTTAMTGGQRNASSNSNNHNHVRNISMENVIKAIGIENISIIKGCHKDELEKQVWDYYNLPGVKVVIFRKNCILFSNHGRGV